MTLEEQREVINKEIEVFDKKLKNILSIISNAYTYKHFKPKIRFFDSIKKISVEYSEYFEENNVIVFIYSFINNIIEIEPNISAQGHKYQSNEKLLYLLNNTSEISKIAYQFDTNGMEKLFSKYLIIHEARKNVLVNFKILSRKIKFKENEIAMKPLFFLFPKLNSFCIDSFLCDKYKISYIDKPNEKNLKELKATVKNKKTDRLHDVYHFISYKQERSHISFFTIMLSVCFDNGTFLLKSAGKTVSSKEEINQELSNQFTFNNEIVNFKSINNNTHLKSFFSKDFLTYKTKTCISFKKVLSKIHYLKTSNSIHEF
jgi:hypothetical protein